MKIFSNFDTKLRQKTFEEYQEKCGPENVLCFWRSRLYRLYKVVFPLLFLTSFAALVLVFFYGRLGGDYFGYIVTAIIIIFIVFFFPVIGKYIDYKMDFIIVIQNTIMMYDQGDIVILTQGDTEDNSEVVLRRIPRPEKRKNQILKIIGMDLQANQNPKI